MGFNQKGMTEMMMYRALLQGAGLLVVLAVAACGGGGGDSPAAPPAPSTPVAPEQPNPPLTPAPPSAPPPPPVTPVPVVTDRIEALDTGLPRLVPQMSATAVARRTGGPVATPVNLGPLPNAQGFEKKATERAALAKGAPQQIGVARPVAATGTCNSSVVSAPPKSGPQ